MIDSWSGLDLTPSNASSVELTDKLLKSSNLLKRRWDYGGVTSSICDITINGINVGVVEASVRENLQVLTFIYINPPHRGKNILKYLFEDLTHNRFFFVLHPSPLDFRFNWWFKKDIRLTPSNFDEIKREDVNVFHVDDKPRKEKLANHYRKMGLRDVTIAGNQHTFLGNHTVNIPGLLYLTEPDKKKK